MKFVKNMNLDYVEPAGGKNLYDGVDLSVEDFACAVGFALVIRMQKLKETC